MPTDTIPTPQDVAEQFAEFNDQALAKSKKLGTLYLDSFDEVITSFATFEKKLAAEAPNDAFKGVLSAHADFVTQLSKSYTKIARETLS